MNESSPYVQPSRALPSDVSPTPQRTPGLTPDLIVGPEPADAWGDDTLHAEVLAPKPSTRLPRWASPESTSRVEAAIARVGRKWLHGEEILGQWLAEARGLARDLEEKLARGSLEEVGTAARRVSEVLGWVDAVTTEQRKQSALAARGFDVYDPAVLLRDAARHVHGRWPAIDLALPPLGVTEVVCRAGALGRAFDLALEAVIRRIGGVGAVQLEVEEGALYVLHRIRGSRSVLGDPGAGRSGIEVPEVLAGRLRHLVVQIHGGRLFRGPTTDDDAAITIGIPRRE
ncbi:MAG: hypothetical protein H6832_00810 [Planctomycetes bacterium]|nr:hypothetical protein [Planctomycetota bacterium]MCB9916924.1 hypothetical protein [Planctomycetota bacterium]